VSSYATVVLSTTDPTPAVKAESAECHADGSEIQHLKNSRDVTGPLQIGTKGQRFGLRFWSNLHAASAPVTIPTGRTTLKPAV